MPEQDIIYVQQLEIEIPIGFHEWERKMPQLVLVDLEMYVDTRAAALTNKVKDVVDYEQIIERLRTVATEHDYLLVEALAARIAYVVLREFGVARVKVRVSKPNAVAGTQNVGVEIERSADDASLDDLDRS